MRRSHLFSSITITAVLVFSALAASAQTGQLRGHVLLKQADGTTVKVSRRPILTSRREGGILSPFGKPSRAGARTGGEYQ